MALENYRITEFQEKTQVDNGDYVLIDSATDGTHKYQLSRIPAQASAEVAAAVAAEKTAREAADAAEVTARNAAIGAAISDEVTARNAAIAANVDDTLSVSGKAADAKKTGDEIADVKADLNAINEYEIDGIRRVAKWVNGTYSGMTLNNTNTRIRPNYWVFVKAGDTVTVNNGTHYVHTGVIRKGTISSSTVVRSDSAWVTTNETITIANDGFLMFSFADVENKSLVLNPDDFDGAIDVTSYAKRNVDALTATIKNGIGDAYTYNISLGNTSSIGKYWNTYIDYPVKIGDVITFTFNEYSGIKLRDCILRGIRNDDTHENLVTGIKEGNTISIVSQENYKQLWVQLSRSEAENSVTASFFIATDASGGIVGHVLDTEKHVYHVEKDGSGDFTKLATAIEYAEQFMDSTVYVGAGTWDIINELGSDYVQSVDSSKRGIVLKNRIHLIFSSEALVTCIYKGIDGVIKDDTVSWLSAFNAGDYGFTLENCRIQSRNVRYSVHDEMGLTNNKPYINRYINCQMSHNNQKYDQSQGTHGYGQCIGGGLGTDGYIEINGCVFENTYQYSSDSQGRKVLVSYHTQNSSTHSRSQIEIKGCYFKDNGTCRGTYINTNTDVSTMLVHDNSFGKEPFIGAETQSATVENIEMIAWNNEIRTA